MKICTFILLVSATDGYKKSDERILFSLVTFLYVA